MDQLGDAVVIRTTSDEYRIDLDRDALDLHRFFGSLFRKLADQDRWHPKRGPAKKSLSSL